jgi:hypothetical protein
MRKCEEITFKTRAFLQIEPCPMAVSDTVFVSLRCYV